MISLLLTIICSTSIALILKLNDTKSGNPLLLLAANYFVASLLGLYMIISEPSSVLSSVTVIFAAILAGLFVFSFFAFAKAVNVAGTALATISSRLSVAIPLILSVFVFSERPSVFQLAGFVFTFLTIGLFYFTLRKSKTEKIKFGKAIYLLLVLVGIGISDFGLKIFHEWRLTNEISVFIFFIFLCSFIYSSILVIGQKIPLDKIVIARGAALGIPNVLSTVFLLSALDQFPAIVVYPVINIGIIILTTLAAAVIWQDRLNNTGYLALISGITAIIFLAI